MPPMDLVRDTSRLPWPIRALVTVRDALWPTSMVQAIALGKSWSFHPWATAAAGLEAFETDPWMKAAITAKANDAAGLPLLAYRRIGNTKKILEPDEAPPLLRLLRRPALRRAGRAYRIQSYVDYLATGDALTWRRTGELRRLCPAAVVVDPDKVDMWGDALYWRWTDAHGNGHNIPDAQVIHVRAPNGAREQNAPRGSGPIQALSKGIQTSSQAKHLAASQAGRGQYNYIGTTPQGMQPQALAELERKLEEKLGEGKAVTLLSGGATLTQASPRIRDLEYGTIHETSRDEIGACIGVPPTRMGVAPAGYGSAKQEDRAYWVAMTTGILAAFEDAWDLHLFDDSLGLSHDLSQIASLRTVQLDQIEAAERLASMGLTAADALEYVGLEDAADLVDEDADGEADGGEPGRPGGPSADPDPQELDLVHALRGHLRRAAQVAERHDGRDPVAIDRWRATLADLEAPLELAPRLAEEEELAVDFARMGAARDGSDLANFAGLAVFGGDRAQRIAAEIAATRKAA